EVRARVYDVESDTIADVGLEHVLLVLERTAVEDYLGGALRLLGGPVRGRGEKHADLGGIALLRVELALDEDEFLVGRGAPAIPGIDDEWEIHTLHEVHGDGRSSAMDHERACIARDELELHRILRHDNPVCFVGWNSRRVKVYLVLHRRIVDDRDADLVANADVDDGSRHCAAEGPAFVGYAVGDLQGRVLDRNAKFLDRRVNHGRKAGVVRG